MFSARSMREQPAVRFGARHSKLAGAPRCAEPLQSVSTVTARRDARPVQRGVRSARDVTVSCAEPDALPRTTALTVIVR